MAHRHKIDYRKVLILIHGCLVKKEPLFKNTCVK